MENIALLKMNIFEPRCVLNVVTKKSQCMEITLVEQSRQHEIKNDRQNYMCPHIQYNETIGHVIQIYIDNIGFLATFHPPCLKASWIKNK